MPLIAQDLGDPTYVASLPPAAAAGGGGGPTPIAQWKFNDGSGTSAADGTGNGNTGTASGNPTWGTGPNSNGDAVFDGTGDFFTAANESNFDFERSDDFTVTAWIRLHASASGNSATIISKESSSGNSPGIQLRANPDNTLLQCFLIQADGNVISAATAGGSILNDTWYFVAVTYDGSSTGAGISLYINNGSAVTGSGTLSQSILNNDALKIGDGPASLEFFGQIDDVRVYDSDLTSGEIGTIYSGGAQ